MNDLKKMLSLKWC